MGYNIEECVNIDFNSFLHKDDLADFINQFRRLYNDTEGNGIIEFRIKHKNGKYFWNESSCYFYKSEIDDKKFLVLNNRNINERKEAELKLKEKNEEYLSVNEELKQANEELITSNEQAIENFEHHLFLLDNMVNGVLYIDSSGLISYMNPAAEKLLGLHLSQISKTKNALQFLNAIDSNETPIKQDLLPTNIVFSTAAPINDFVMGFENSITKQFHWINLNIIPKNKKFKDNKYQIFVTFEDISNLKQINSDLSKSKIEAENYAKQYKLLFDNLTIGLALHELICNDSGTPVDYRFININKAFEDLTGLKAELVVGKTVKEVMPDIEDYWIETYGKVAINHETIHYENYAQPLNKHFKVAAFSPQHMHFAVLVEDVTQKKQYEEDLKIAKEKAEESDRLKSAFLANMSHEIRTPMNGILGFSELLSKPGLTDERKVYYSKIVNECCNQLLNVVNDILDISKIESGIIDIKNEKVNVNNLINDLYTFYKPQTSNKNISLFINKELSEYQSEISTDKNRLRQILMNLVNNAIKFTTTGHIKFGYYYENKYLKFFVEDTGIGIDKDKHTIIFEHFRQVETNLAKNYGGTGLGLSISQKLVEVLGGEIGIESEINKGTTFWFTIPYNPIKKNIISQNFEHINMDNKITILVAEDEDVNFLYIEEVLMDSEVELIHTENGQEAITICKENPNIDLILMDIKMPVLNGIEATKQIKAFRNDIIIIAQTAYAMSNDKDIAMNAGCDAYLTKPINPRELISIIDNYKESILERKKNK
ncbi:MAG: response regulator [Bacteroidales bacterium]|nr:response regulator [Bacteroidales bacterium]